MHGIVNDSMDKGSIMDSEDRKERIVDIYVSAEAVRDMKHKKETEDFNTEEPQTPRHTGSDGVTISRAAGVCLGLVCVLLLTAVIVLCVIFTQEREQLKTKIINLLTNNMNLTEERQQLKTKITNLTEERDQLQTNNMNLTRERQQLQTKITNLLTNNMNLTEERDQLQTNNMNLTEERDQLQTNNMNLTRERQQLQTKITNLLTNNMNLTEERQQLQTKITNLTEERDQLKSERKDLLKKFADGWKCHQSHLYFISSETKNWNESRRYCTEREADLIIINNREEQDFVKNISGSSGHFWIGLTDVEVEGRWKWVDGSTLTSGFWASGQPDSYQGTEEDCAVTYSSGWFDTQCNNSAKWICEKSILK